MRGLVDTVDTLITGPASEPLDIQEMVDRLRLFTGDESSVESWITAAREYFEEQTGRQVITATRERWLDQFPCGTRIELPYPPLLSVVSVTYINGDGDATVWNDDGASPTGLPYVVKAPSGPYAQRGYLELGLGQQWPTPKDEAGAVRVRYTCGYGATASDVPASVKAAISLLVGSFEQFRSETFLSSRGTPVRLPLGADHLIDSFKYSAMPQIVMRRYEVAPWS